MNADSYRDTLAPIVLAITGTAGSGKDSLATYLATEYGFATTRFSGPLKDLCCDLFGWDPDRVNDLDYKEARSRHRAQAFTREEVGDIVVEQFGLHGSGPDVVAHIQANLNAVAPGWTRRRILQWVGTEGFRDVDPDHWQRKGLEAVEAEIAAGAPGVSMTDVRFPNEFEGLVGTFGAKIVRVVCTDRATGTGDSGHVSESFVDSIEPDVILTAAYGHLDDLYAAGGRLVEALGARRVDLGPDLRP